MTWLEESRFVTSLDLLSHFLVPTYLTVLLSCFHFGGDFRLLPSIFTVLTVVSGRLEVVALFSPVRVVGGDDGGEVYTVPGPFF